MAGNTAICAGWASTPESRMACCAEDANCPMHEHESHDAGSGHALTQFDADSCCLSSEREEPANPSPLTLVATISFAVLGPGVPLSASVPALVLSDDWRTALPIPSTPVPRYVLLSVFLV
jgi:hypothetical protein